MASKGKAFGFGMVAFKKHPELIPLISVMGIAVLGVSAFIGYSLLTKTDIRINKSSDIPPWEQIGATETRKFMVVKKELYRPIPELEKLREEIGSYRG